MSAYQGERYYTSTSSPAFLHFIVADFRIRVLKGFQGLGFGKFATQTLKCWNEEIHKNDWPMA